MVGVQRILLEHRVVIRVLELEGPATARLARAGAERLFPALLPRLLLRRVLMADPMHHPHLIGPAASRGVGAACSKAEALA